MTERRYHQPPFPIEAVCAACHAKQERNLIRCEQCGAPLVFVTLDAYRDSRFEERPCDHCGQPYRGPAVYCSLACAEADA